MVSVIRLVIHALSASGLHGEGDAEVRDQGVAVLQAVFSGLMSRWMMAVRVAQGVVDLAGDADRLVDGHEDG